MISPEMIGVLITAGSGLFLGGVAWTDVKRDSAANTNSIKELKIAMDKKIDEHIDDNLKTDESRRGWIQRNTDWQGAHEREANNMRFELQKQMSKLESDILISSARYDEIVRLISGLTETLSKEMDQLKIAIKELRK